MCPKPRRTLEELPARQLAEWLNWAERTFGPDSQTAQAYRSALDSIDARRVAAEAEDIDDQ